MARPRLPYTPHALRRALRMVRGVRPRWPVSRQRRSRPLGDATTPPAGRAPSPHPGRPVASARGSLAEQAHTTPVAGAARRSGISARAGAGGGSRRQGGTRPISRSGWLLPWSILDQCRGAGAHLHGLLSLRGPTPSRGSPGRGEPPGASSGAGFPRRWRARTAAIARRVLGTSRREIATRPTSRGVQRAVRGDPWTFYATAHTIRALAT